MARKRRSWMLDYLVYLLVRTGICLVQVLSWDLALGLARGLGWLTYLIDRRHRLIASENLRYAFPELDEHARTQLVRRTFEHFATVLIEMIRMPVVMRRGNYQKYTHWMPEDGEAQGLAWASCGRPLLILTGHLGNWEILGYAIGLVGLRAGVIARKIDNPHLDRLVRQLRQKTGQEILDKNSDYDRILSRLASGQFVAMLGDQDAGSRGLFVPFLGRPASTFKSIALLSLEYQAPILVIGSARIAEPMRYRLYFEEVILPEEYLNHPEAIRAITERYTQALERMIRRHPEQYFWLHRRWKHQPRRAAQKKVA